MELEGEPQALLLTGAGILTVIGGLVIGVETVVGAVLAVMGIANIIISGYVYYDN